MNLLDNGTWPAYPVSTEHQGCYQKCPGLTKRELFAAMAMQGQLADSSQDDNSPRYVSMWSVAYADALLAELAKEPTDGD